MSNQPTARDILIEAGFWKADDPRDPAQDSGAIYDLLRNLAAEFGVSSLESQGAWAGEQGLEPPFNIYFPEPYQHDVVGTGNSYDEAIVSAALRLAHLKKLKQSSP